MAVQNSLVKKEEKMSISTFLNAENVVGRIENALGKSDKQRFITGVVSAVTANPSLKECENGSILSAALLGESLKLSPSPQLGQYFMVPYEDKKKGKVAVFEIGYKGYIQLALRSGYYKKINVLPIKKGELEYFDPLNEEIRVKMMVEDWDARLEAETTGYYVMYELLNGMKKSMYWSKKQMLKHADTYVQAFSLNGTDKKVSYEDYLKGKYPKKDSWMYSSHWYKNFDDMAMKTMLRQIFNRWGLLSTEMQTALDNDMTFTDESGTVQYPEADDTEPIVVEAVEVVPEQPQPKAEEVEFEEFDSAEEVANALFGK